jgi:hypothetical protein
MLAEAGVFKAVSASLDAIYDELQAPVITAGS